MYQQNDGEAASKTQLTRTDREMIFTRTFDAAPHIVFAAWTTPDLFRQWWAPRSMGMSIVMCELDVRTGGGYRLQFAGHEMVFFGKYIEVVPNARMVWTNEEGDAGAVTTVTFTPKGDKTVLTYSELYPSKEALDFAFEGMEGGLPEQLDQLDELLAAGIAQI